MSLAMILHWAALIIIIGISIYERDWGMAALAIVVLGNLLHLREIEKRLKKLNIPQVQQMVIQHLQKPDKGTYGPGKSTY